MDEQHAVDMALYLLNEQANIVDVEIRLTSGETKHGAMQVLELGSGYPSVAFVEHGLRTRLDLATVATADIRRADGTFVRYGDAEAIAAVDAATARHHFSRGIAHLQAGRDAAGLSEMLETVKLDPTVHQAWFNIGMGMRASDPATAARAFSEFLRYSPEHPDTAAYRDFARNIVVQNGLEIPTSPTERSTEPRWPVVHAVYEKDGERIAVALSNDTGLEASEVEQLIAAFAAAPTTVHAYLLYKAEPALSSGFVSSYLELMSNVLADKDDRLSAVLNRRLLTRSREVGAVNAFAEEMAIDPEVFSMLVRGIEEVEPRLKQYLSLAAAERDRALAEDRFLLEHPALDTYMSFLVQQQPDAEAKATLQQLAWSLRRFRDSPRPEPANAGPSELTAAVKLLEESQDSLVPLAAAIEKLLDLRARVLAGGAVEQLDLIENVIGAALAHKFVLDGSIDSLSQGVAYIRGVLSRTPAASYEHQRAAINLAGALVKVHEAVGSLSDLNEAIALCRQVLADLPGGAEEERVARSTLASALTQHGRFTSNLSSLDEAVLLLEALQAVLQSDGRTLNLSLALRYRYHLNGHMQDLDRSIALAQSVVSRSKRGVASWMQGQINLAAALHARGKKVAHLPDVDAAIDVYRSVLAASPDPESNVLVRVNLANTLCTRSEIQESLPDLEESIQLARAAVATKPAVADAREWNRTLAVSLLRRFQLIGDGRDIEEALEILRTIEADPVASAMTRQLALSNLGSAWLTRYRHNGSTSDLENAVFYLSTALARAKGRLDDPTYQFQLSLQLSQVAAEIHDWSTAVEAGEIGIAAAESIYEAQLFRAGRETVRAEVQTLYAHYAFALCATGRPGEAAVVMESSRARQLSEALDLRGKNLERLVRSGASELVRDYSNTASLLSHLYGAETSSSDKDLGDLIRRARDQYSDVLRRVRAVAG